MLNMFRPEIHIMDAGSLMVFMRDAFYLVSQKHIIEGVTAGAVKG